jgi:hypothetical protein
MFAGAELQAGRKPALQQKKRMAETCQTRAEVEVDDVHECMTL